MDRTSRFFVLMVLIALVAGWVVLRFCPDFKPDKILQTNDENRYYPTVK